MTKTNAMKLLNCSSQLALAKCLNVSHTTVNRWPEDLPFYAIGRVMRALGVA